jgi:D-glycero-D-manno-heptose 1,7-bisphosphate phosphatase
VRIDRPAVLRDGVVSSPRSAEELSVPPGAEEALARLRQAGYALVVVTNQPDLARGLLDHGTVDRLHETLMGIYHVEGFYVCPHERNEGCSCRKPAPGLFVEAANRLGLCRTWPSWSVGDRWVDVVAGEAAGVRTALLERPWSWDPAGGLIAPAGTVPDVASWDLGALVDRMLAAGR